MALAVTMTADNMPDEQTDRIAPETDAGDLLDNGRMGASHGQTHHRPSRSCILTRAVLPESDLIRFVVGPDGSVVPDLKRRLPGRGAWVTATHDAVSGAVKKRAFARAFKGVGKPEDDLADQVGALLRDAALGGLGLARKAGLAVTGFAKVEAAIRSGRAAAVLHAADAADNGIAKLGAAIRSAASDEHADPIVESSLPSGMLSMALGGAHVIHAALMKDRRSASALEALSRYRGFGMPQADLEKVPGPDGATD